MSNKNELQRCIDDLVIPGKGILAADESTGTIKKRFATINTESTPATHRDYRQLLFEAPGLNEHVSGVILFEETLAQSSADGKALPEILSDQGIVPGIKVDKGLVALPCSPNEKTTQGLDALAERLQGYKDQGARFAKWRAVYSITDDFPTHTAVRANAEGLARYASICQANGVVPIVEPELLMDGTHSLERCQAASEWAFHEVFHALYLHGVELEYIVLKPSMVIAGKESAQQSSPEEVARATVQVLKRCVPAAVPSINFLSGGQTPEQATANLDAMNRLGPLPWYLSFSYGRALQEPALKAWSGRADNTAAAQSALLKRARLNGAAALGQFEHSMEAQTMTVD